MVTEWNWTSEDPASPARLRAMERQRQKQYADETVEWWCPECSDRVTTSGKWSRNPVCRICFGQMVPYYPIVLPSKKGEG